MTLGRLSLRSAGPVIGLMGDWLDHTYQQVIVQGALAAARDRGAKLLCFIGGPLLPAGAQTPRQSAFDLIGPESVDALVVMTGPLMNQAGASCVGAFAERLRPLPLVSISAHLTDGVPTVRVDNSVGIERALTHLVRDHGLAHVAFVSGPVSNEEAAARLETFRQVRAALSLPSDHDLVCYGDFSAESGARAVRELLDERRVPPHELHAVLCANDAMAMGAMAELALRGLRTPEDVAVAGFDDVDESRYTSPPLTTVRQPLREQGREAVRLALAALRGEAAADIDLRTELVPRRSCGCFSHQVGVPHSLFPPGHSFEASLVERRQILLAELSRTARGRFGVLGTGWEARLVNAFAEQVRGRGNVFIETVDDIVRRIGEAGVDFALYHDVVSSLRRELLPCLSGEHDRRRLGEALLDEARRLGAETAERYEARGRLEALRYGSLLARHSSSLGASFEPAWLASALPALREVGVRSCAIAAYTDPSGPLGTAEIIAATGVHQNLGGRAGARELIRAVAEAGDADGYCVMALFQDGRLHGFALFELGLRMGAGYESLRELASSALEGRRLRERVRELEQELGSGRSA